MTIADSCRHYAPMGMSMSATAAVLGIPAHKFRLAVKDEGLRHLFDASSYARDCRGGGRGWVKGRLRPYRVRVPARFILSELRRYSDLTLFQSMADVNIATVHRRFGCASAAHRFARLTSPSDPMWHFVADVADGCRLP
jgi:hypothetical protein